MPGEWKVWDAATGELLHDLRGHAKEVVGVAFSPNGRQLVSASGDHTIRVWDLADGREVQRLEHTEAARSVVFSPDGKLLLSGGYDGVRVWDAGTGKPLGAFPQLGTLVAVSPDGKYLASDQPGGARVWSLARISEGEPFRIALVHSF